MDDFQHSLLKNRKFSNRNACYQTSGTPSKCAVSSFADYNEIFGNLFPPRSSPVPILDFPLLEDDQVSPGIPSTNLDYSDIFGCLCVGAYEQVVSESYGPEYSPTKFSLQDAKGTRLQAPATVSSASLEVCDQELLASTKKDYAPSNVNSQHIHNEAKLFNMSYKRSNQILMRDSLCGMVGPAYDDKLPGITVLSGSCLPQHKDKSADSLTQGTRNVSQDSTMMEVDHIGETISQHPVEKSQKDRQADHIQHYCILGDSKDATLSEHSMLNSFSSHMLQSDLKKNQEGLSTASDCDPEIGNDLNPSCHLVSYLPSGKDTSSQGNVFLTVTDIDLQTQPSQLPPPSRLPPKVGSPQWMECSQDVLSRWKPLRIVNGYQFGPGFKTHALDESCKNESSPLFDVGADANSTAPSSAAAIREAMDKAKAKLKSAKESLERTRGEYPDCMKLRLYEHKKINERKESGSAQESLILEDDVAPNHELKEGYGNNMGHVELIKESLYRFKDDSSRFLDTHKLEDRTAERKVNKQFYDLANNEENCKIILEWDNDETNSMPSGRNLMHKQKTTETLQVEDVLEKNEILRMVNETYERAHYSIPKESVRARRCKEGDKKVEATQVSGQMEETKKTKVAAEAPEQEDVIECESGLVAGSHIEHEKRLKAACEHDDGTTRLKAASEYAEEKGLKVVDKNEEASNRLKMANKHEEEELKLKAACDHVEEKRLRATQRLDEEERSIKAAHDCTQEVKRLIVTCVHPEEAKRLNAACAFEEDKILKAAHDYEEVENRLKAACENTQEKKREKAAHLSETETSLKYGHDVEEISREVASYGSEGYCEKVVPHEWKEVETKLRSSLEAHIDGEHAKKKESVRQLEEREKLVEMVKRGHAHYAAEESLEVRKGNEKLKEIQDTHEIEGSKNIIEATWKVYVGSDKGEKTQETKVAKLQVQETQILKQAHQVYEWDARENKQRKTCEKNEENNKKVHAAKAVLLKNAAKSKEFSDALRWDHNEKEQKAVQTVQEQERNEKKMKVLKQACDTAANEKRINELVVLHDKDKINNITPARENIKEAEAEREKVAQFDCCLNRGEKLFRTALQVTMSQDREREDKTTKKVHEKEEKEKEERVEREREQEKERLRKLEEDIEREREREKDRIAVERARSEACATELVEARERLERASLDSVTTEARLRALAEARERSEKASLDVARIKAERAAVERAIAEARKRAAEKVMADRTAASNSADGELWQSSDAQDFNGTDGHPSIRCKARLERHQRMVEHTAKALAEKSLRNIIVQREQAERNSLAETLDADVRRWSNGKEGNLRALLSTLQYVLGSESGWQPISLTDVITAAAVKKAYRKATLCVHPDKVQQRGASIQQKYICEKVFDLLKDAWNKFNSEGR